MAGRAPLRPGQRPELPPPLALKPKWGGQIARPSDPHQATVLVPPQSAPTEGLTSDRLRDRMVSRLRQQGIDDPVVLAAMKAVPRHLFVDAGLASRAYEDSALPIGHSQTISQPYVVARALALARSALGASGQKGQGRALEIGGGCGYQAAVLAQVFDEVVSVERIAGLHRQARRNLFALKLPNLHLVHGDGMSLPAGLGRFRAVFLAAGMPSIPEHLLRELDPGGVLVAPIGSPTQRLVVLRLLPEAIAGAAPAFERREFEEVSFVPILRGLQS
jgi:protein-L-isoaspartate(D-aspartate) O-methyltransferase